MRDLLIRYLRWSSKRHWAVKVFTAIVLLPIYLVTPASAWDELVKEAFG